MNEIVIQDECFAKISYLNERKLIQVIWNGDISDEQYRKTFLSVLSFQEKSGYHEFNFLSDTRNQGAVSPESRKWFTDYCIPESIKMGLISGAVVYNGSVFKKYYLNLILQATNKFKLPFKFFLTFEEAYSWFDSFSKKK